MPTVTDTTPKLNISGPSRGRLAELERLRVQIEAEIARERELAPYRLMTERYVAAVAAAYVMAPEEITSSSKAAPTVEARSVVCWLLRKREYLSLPVIGRLVDRDHSTVLAAVRRVDNSPIALQVACAIPAIEPTRTTGLAA